MTLEQWLQEYDLSHRHPVNIRIHKICVPAIVFALLGLLSSVPSPLNLAWLAAAAGLAFYWRLGRAPALAMAAMCLPMLLLLEAASRAGLPLALLSLGLFVVAWIGQFVGHAIEGKKPSFLRDLQFLLIGPLWTLRRWL
ncbi:MULTISPECIES: DUF962 domain-containing protein [Chromobacterium]|uniref:Mpo1 family 2-hydroxy fatty acid dioxygenase n=1 Tax=Chromobacterium TaxID=535 RepID=UPI000D318428|nr:MULTISPECIES: Mpo1-like protein [Chromobacterium]PTU67376.1 hypothetical protein DB032_21835 [Chromobacterium sp. Panama]UJB32956.1 DUF962 domain-containing protein [Chromobacterium sp. Beijing]